jgi:hypothetical protein
MHCDFGGDGSYSDDMDVPEVEETTDDTEG